MKNLTDFIYEALEDNVTLKSLEVKWECPEDVFIQVPESYGESEVQIYLDDTLLKDMPLESDTKALGKNEKELTDVYFEYEKMDAAQGTTQKADIEWDDNYDQSMNGTGMKVMHIYGLKYCGMFDSFTLENVEKDDDDSIRDTLFSLFDGMDNDVKDELPFDLSLNKDNITWKK